jgi:hypothetical protein
VSLTLLKRFRGVNDTADINVTPLKSQTDFTSPFPSPAMTPLKPILATFEAIISANTMPYAKRFSLLIRDIYGVD